MGTETSRDFTILYAGVQIDRQVLELLCLPDGTAGAKWGGLVFPLRDDERIDLTDRGTLPGQCAPWADRYSNRTPSGDVPSASGYLYIEGSTQTCTRTVHRLESAGIRVLRSGPNLSDNSGDWFIRLDTPSDGERKRITEILAEISEVVPAEDNSSLRERLLVQALGAARSAQEILRVELDQARSAALAPPIVTAEERNLRETIEEISSRLAEAQAESDALRARLAAAPRAAPKPNRLESELATAAEGMLPRVDLIGDSLRFIAVELPDRMVLWKALSALDRQERGQPTGWKSVAGHSGWWERHFSTGQDNQGRIYARLAGQPGRWQVLVSHKQDQPEDLRRIARM